jgi:integrase
MATVHKPFTDAVVRLLAARAVPGDYVDLGLPGLYLRVGRKSASWSVNFKVSGEGGLSPSGHRLKGRAKRLHIGDYPGTSLAEARHRAAAAFARSTAGEDPKVRAFDAAEANKVTIAWLVDRYMVEYVEPSLRSAKNARHEFNRHWVPKFGHRPAHSIRRRELNEHVLEIARSKKHGPGAALEARRWIVALYGWALRRDYVEQSPATGLVGKADLRQRPTDLRPRERVLSIDEARACYQAAGQLGDPWGPLARLLLLTMARLGEFKKSKAGWFHEGPGNFEVPSFEHKNGDPKTIPLPRAAIEILRARPRGDHGPYLFSTTGGLKPIYSFSDLYADKLRALTAEILSEQAGRPVEVEHFRIHDLRRTGATHLTAQGASMEVVELLLGHRIGGIRGVYMKHRYLEERRVALEAWATLLGARGAGSPARAPPEAPLTERV